MTDYSFQTLHSDVWAAAEKLVVEEIRQKHQWMRARKRRT